MLPGFTRSDCDTKMETPVFGLASIEDSDLFDKNLQIIEKQILKNFYSKLSKLHHYGKLVHTYLPPPNVGFPLLTYLISKKRINQAITLLEKYPKFLQIYSEKNWSPLHEAVRIESAKLIHILIRKGADFNHMGSMDIVENEGVSIFGTRHISPKMMTKTWYKSMLNIMNCEIEHRNKYGIDINHLCTLVCGKLVAENDKNTPKLTHINPPEKDETNTVITMNDEK